MDMKVGSVKVKMFDGDRIADHVERKGKFEPRSLEQWSKMVQPGTTVVDVGAYTGLFSISAALLGAHVIAVEPIRRLTDRLQQNAELNGVKLTIYKAAASDRAGNAMIAHNPAVAFSAGASMARKSGPRERVRLMRLDDLNLDNVSAIKMDVERHEPAVIRGARALIDRCRPLLLVEALDEDMTKAVLAELPDYKMVRRMDTRNMYLEPRK